MQPLQLYQPRQPRRSPLWQCVHDHAATFRQEYPRQHLARYWNCATAVPGNPDKMNIAFRAGTGGLHSAEN